MEVKSFMEYVHQKRVEGKSDKQIATSLGMSLKRLNTMLSGSKAKEENNPEPVIPMSMRAEIPNDHKFIPLTEPEPLNGKASSEPEVTAE